MPLMTYAPKRFSTTREIIIGRAIEIIEAYAEQGYDLTLRQLYYQFVSRNWLPDSWADEETGSTNNERSYKKLGTIISDARRAGRIDWNAIVDRTRNIHNPPIWKSPAALVSACAARFDVDWWQRQRYRPEVWVEKDALLGVIEVACGPFHCPYFSCRGYTSDSEMWSAAQRLVAWHSKNQTPVVIHLGDHDPSGIDMSRDIREKLSLFAGRKIEVKRIALNMEQVREHNPPPNPAKISDSRYRKYEKEHGDESWELDALNPDILSGLIEAAVAELIDEDEWRSSLDQRDRGRVLLSRVADEWDRITASLDA